MPYIPPNTQPIYECAMIGYPTMETTAICTFTYVATTPGSFYDRVDRVLQLFTAAMAPAVWGYSRGWQIFDVASAHTPPGYNHSEAYFDYLITPGTPFHATPAPEASFILRRVGAGSPPNVRGRCFVPGLVASDFTDLPKCRHTDSTLPWRVTQLAHMNAGLVGLQPYITEVLYNRRTGGCWPVTAYTSPDRVGRVWQRAGWPHR